LQNIRFPDHKQKFSVWLSQGTLLSSLIAIYCVLLVIAGEVLMAFAFSLEGS